MTPFMDENFLLKNEPARILYHDYAAGMPIMDYHCHLNPQEIYENRKFENLTAIWLGGDHYKWRLMRAGGVEEQYVTGDAPDREKFQKYVEVLSRAIGNPRLARVVGYALHVNPEPGVIPCHRVVKRNGEVSSAFAFGGANRQVELLKAEGVGFLDGSHVDMTQFCVRALPLILEE